MHLLFAFYSIWFEFSFCSISFHSYFEFNSFYLCLVFGHLYTVATELTDPNASFFCFTFCSRLFDVVCSKNWQKQSEKMQWSEKRMRVYTNNQLRGEKIEFLAKSKKKQCNFEWHDIINWKFTTTTVKIDNLCLL